MNNKAVKSQARVVVIGGGIAGCSTLYHLTREGWNDVVLLERDELTSGSTWHAAAQVTQFGANQTMVALKRYSIDLYRELAADPENPISYHITGGMRLAHTPEQVDTYKHFIGMAGGMGVEMEFIDAAEAGRRHPLMNTDGLLGAWWDPLDGDIDPAGITFAMARQARAAGAEVYRFNPVESITRKLNGEFIVHSKNGDITCEKVVNATGYRVNEVGNMLGVDHPVTSMEHMYFLTDTLPELEALDYRVPIIRDPGDDFYSRQEKNGLLVGVYEQGCHTFGMDGIDPDFTQALCPSDRRSPVSKTPTARSGCAPASANPAAMASCWRRSWCTANASGTPGFSTRAASRNTPIPNTPVSRPSRITRTNSTIPCRTNSARRRASHAPRPCTRCSSN